MIELISKEKLSTKDNILLQAFKLYLVNNVESVTVEELEKSTNISRGAIFYHFQNKENIFKNTLDTYFFSNTNIFYPFVSDLKIKSLRDYLELRKERIEAIINWFLKLEIATNPFDGFIHLIFQAKNYYPDFQFKMSKLILDDIAEWKKAIQIGINNNEILNTIDIEIVANIFRAVFYTPQILQFPNASDNYQFFKSFDLIYNSVRMNK